MHRFRWRRLPTPMRLSLQRRRSRQNRAARVRRFEYVAAGCSTYKHRQGYGPDSDGQSREQKFRPNDVGQLRQPTSRRCWLRLQLLPRWCCILRRPRLGQHAAAAKLGSAITETVRRGRGRRRNRSGGSVGGGTFSREAAQSFWQVLVHRFPEALGQREPVVIRFEHDGAVFWRVRAEGFASLSEAQTLCARMRAGCQACFRTPVLEVRATAGAHAGDLRYYRLC